MLPPIADSVHLSVAGGCGGTTLGLQYARNVLSDGNHVVWICEEMPDGDRFSQIFSELSPVAVSKFHLSAVGDNTEIGSNSAIGLLEVLNNIDLVVVDDWTAKFGKPSSELSRSMKDLISICGQKNVSLMAISSAYEDAGGAGWKSRGNLNPCDIWFLHRSQIDSMRRELHIGNNVTEYNLSDDGFTLRK